MRPRRAAPHTLAGAYALDALDGRDRAGFRRHLARCRECAQEADGLREAAARLAAAVATAPSAAMKKQVLSQAARTRQLSPAAGSPPGRGRLLVPRLALVLAAVLLLVIGVVWLTGPSGRPGDGHVAAVLNAPDAAMFHARIATGGTATVVMSHRARMLVFTAAGLRPLPVSERYELWLMGPEGDRPARLTGLEGTTPAGVLPLPRHGMTGPVAASGLRSGDRLGLSVEPASGSARPTSAMIMVVGL